MNIATAFTLARLILNPLFLILYIWNDMLGIPAQILPYILIALLGISELSDAFDGYFARRFNQVTDMGKVLDPMTDSIARISVFLAFTQPPVSLPVGLVYVLIYRDALMSILRTLCALQGLALAARTSGKIKAIAQAIAAFFILFMMIPHAAGALDTETLQKISLWTVGIVAIYTAGTAFEYIAVNWKVILRSLKPSAPSN